MDGETPAQNLDNRLRYAVWASLTAIALLDAAMGAHLGIRLTVDLGILKVAFFTSLYTLLAWGMRWLGNVKFPQRRDVFKRTADFLEATTQFVLFVVGYVFFSYLAAAASPMPLVDDALMKFDRALSFDWLAYLHWVDAHPLLARLYTFGYSEWGPSELLLVFGALALCGQAARLSALLLVAFAGALICISVSSLLPAAGMAAQLHLTDANLSHLSMQAGYVQVDDLTRLRAGTLHEISADGFKGMVTFPSYHSCLAVLLTWGAWALRWLRWPVLFLNMVMLAATPVNGGHYLVDTLAGTAIALLLCWFATRLLRRTEQKSKILTVA